MPLGQNPQKWLVSDAQPKRFPVHGYRNTRIISGRQSFATEDNPSTNLPPKMSGQNDDRPSSSGSESTSDSSPPSSIVAIANHDWVSRQLRLRRTEFTETLKAKIKIVSWNVNGKRVAEDLTNLLVENEEPGIYAIGYPILK